MVGDMSLAIVDTAARNLWFRFSRGYGTRNKHIVDTVVGVYYLLNMYIFWRDAFRRGALFVVSGQLLWEYAVLVIFNHRKARVRQARHRAQTNRK